MEAYLKALQLDVKKLIVNTTHHLIISLKSYLNLISSTNYTNIKNNITR